MNKIFIADREKPKRLVNDIIQMFLPLDLDMQTLEILRQKDGDMKEFLEQLYNDDIDYYLKVNKLQSGIRELDKIQGNMIEKTNNIVDDAISFFKKLERKEKNLLGHTWKTDKVNSFHDWYCSLIHILRGGEVDE